MTRWPDSEAFAPVRPEGRKAPTPALVLVAFEPVPDGDTSDQDVRLRRYPAVLDCNDNGRAGAACVNSKCRYHLANRGYWEHDLRPTRDCSLDVANEGPHTLDEVAAVLGVSGERVRQIEEEALAHPKHNSTLKGLYDDSSE